MSRPRPFLYGVDVRVHVCPHCPYALLCLVDGAVPRHMSGEQTSHEFVLIRCRAAPETVRDVVHPVKFTVRRAYLTDARRARHDEA